MIYIVEEWGTVGGDHDECKASYCFDARHEAEAFAEIMKANSRSDWWFIEDKQVFTHMQDVLTLLGVEIDK
jgi:hypothetical protein